MRLHNISFTCSKVCTATSIASYEMKYCAWQPYRHLAQADFQSVSHASKSLAIMGFAYR